MGVAVGVGVGVVVAVGVAVGVAVVVAVGVGVGVVVVVGGNQRRCEMKILAYIAAPFVIFAFIVLHPKLVWAQAKKEWSEK
jgi:hypothetical protein